ncbi:MAG: hypothetical protein RR348_00010 [Clostridia bacterium]
MKKVFLILTIVIIAVCGLSFSGCSGASPTQRLLSDASPWLSNTPYIETSTYAVTKKNDAGVVDNTGSYVVSVQKFVNADISVGANQLANFSGYVATADLKMANNDSEHSVVAFSTNIELKASYVLRTLADGSKTEILGLNTAKKYNFKTAENGAEYGAEKSLKHKKFDAAPYIDKTMLYLVARCVPSTVPSFGFQVLSTTANKKLAVTMLRQTQPQLVDIEFGGAPVSCKAFSISENKTFPGKGTPYLCYVAVPKLNGTSIIADADLSPKANKSAILQIVENNVVYNLVSIVNNKA